MANIKCRILSMLGIITALGLIVAIFFVTLATGFNLPSKTLVFTQILFRHGARGPSGSPTNAEYHQYFPRGSGQLTDRGFNHSHLLGRYLRKRYIDDYQLIDKQMIAKEMYWRSVNRDRCLSTASTVGAAMFESDKYQYLNVAVVTQETNETLLNYNRKGCRREHEIYKEKCSNYEYNPKRGYGEYIKSVYDCLDHKNPIFDKHPFEEVESHIAEYKNGINVDESIKKNIDSMISTYTKITHFINGIGIYQNKILMKIKYGLMVDTLLNNIENAWNEHMEKKIKRKLKVYSTQDWMISGILDSFGVLKETIGYDEVPEFNSMIIMELWNIGEYPHVQFYYKKEEVTNMNHELLDVTKYVRNCPKSGHPCPLERFLSCCDDYRETQIGKSCSI